jgi:NADPH-dependent F420 reductase
MKIAVIGTGAVGGTLGRRWAQGGHEVAFCSRNPGGEKAQALVAAAGANARAALTREGAEAAEVVVLAVPWNAAEEAIRSAGELVEKIVVDCTNPVRPDLSGLLVGTTDSAAEKVARWSGGAHVVKAFNTVHASTMEDPAFGFDPADLLICGDDERAKVVVTQLAEQLGFKVHDAGALTSARFLEPMAMLWIHLALRQMWGTDWTFRVVKKT